MDITSTQKNVLQFIYQELTVSQELEFVDEILNNEESRNNFIEIQQCISLLPKYDLAPSETTLELLFDCAKLDSLETI